MCAVLGRLRAPEGVAVAPVREAKHVERVAARVEVDGVRHEHRERDGAKGGRHDARRVVGERALGRVEHAIVLEHVALLRVGEVGVAREADDQVAQHADGDAALRDGAHLAGRALRQLVVQRRHVDLAREVEGLRARVEEA
eukprot:372347-Prymnesium_polylepis.2